MTRLLRASCLCALASVACSAPESAGPFQWETLGAGGMPLDTAGAAGSSIATAGASGAASAGGAPAFAGAGGGGGALAAGGAPNGEAGSAGAPAKTAFTGAPGFMSAPVTSSALALMSKSGTNPTKTQCLSCHDGTAGVKPFLAGGTVFSDVVQALPAVDYEVRVVDTATGAAFTAHTDENGNFWIAAPATAPSGPFMIGVRNASHSQAMPVLQRGLECNGSACHGGMQGPVHVP